MIVVFVIDTSPSMGQPVSDPSSSTPSPSSSKKNEASGRGMSRLDLAKMAVESLSKALDKRIQEHNRQFHAEASSSSPSSSSPSAGSTTQQYLHNIGLGFCHPDQFLLLSTGRQYQDHPAAAACGAGGRLLVGYDPNHPGMMMSSSGENPQGGVGGAGGGAASFLSSHSHGEFERELKRLKATSWTPRPQPHPHQHQKQKQRPFPEGGGGAAGLNAALSAGLQLLSRYRLQSRSTENFGMGRLPSSAMLSVGTAGGAAGGSAVNALQPACLVLLTDGECLTKSASEGGGQLQLQFGSMPLREFYREPFRWDQRIFCLRVGAPSSSNTDPTSPPPSLHPSLRALCEVTGGYHTQLRSAASLSHITETLVRQIAPPRPRSMPIPDPLRMIASPTTAPTGLSSSAVGGVFANGGPVCSFQTLEGGASGEAPPIHRAMLLYVPYQQPEIITPPGVATKPSFNTVTYQPPIWCISESYFPSKKLDTLPPRLAQPLLNYTRHFQVVGSTAFDPSFVMKALNRLDQLILSNKQMLVPADGATAGGKQTPPIKLLQRDVYVCEWLRDEKGSSAPRSVRNQEHLPVFVRGAGRPSLSEGEENILCVGILHLPHNKTTLVGQATSKGGGGGGGEESTARLATLTLLPPEPHILLPLLVRAAEAEHRALKKAMEKEAAAASAKPGGATAGLIQKQAVPKASAAAVSRSVSLDDSWRTEFRAYLFRVPPYYQAALRRCLRPILPASVHSLLSSDGIEAIAAQCFSRLCLQKIRSGEQIAKEGNERLERQEWELRRLGVQPPEQPQGQQNDQKQTKHRTGADAQDDSAKSSGAAVIGYGQFDPRATVSSYLAALRNMPAPWKVHGVVQNKTKKKEGAKKNAASDESTLQGKGKDKKSALDINSDKDPLVTETLGDLPSECLLPYYESRRRWIYGVSGLTIKGISVEGVNNDGCNSHEYKTDHSINDESILSVAGIGASGLNRTTIAKMGDFRERLLWSRAPVVGYGANDSSGSAATTAADGSALWSVDDDAFPLNFFDPKTGEFNDSVETRLRARLMINFGNPYQDKRGDSLVPEEFLGQRPTLHQEGFDSDVGPRTPPGSPPHDTFSSPVEGEGEAAFAGKKPISPSRKNHHREGLKDDPKHKIPVLVPRAKRQKKATAESSPPKNMEVAGNKEDEKSKPPPPPPPPKLNTSGEHRPTKQRRPPPPPPPPDKKIPAGKQVRQPPPPPPPPLQKHQRQPPPHPPQPKKPPPPPQPLRQGKPQPRPPPPQQGKPPPPPQRQGKPPPPRPSQQQGKPPPPPPHQQRQPPPPQQLKHQKPQPAQPIDMQSPNNKPNVNLPQGWICVWSKSQKRWYFFDTKTNKSVWQWPPPGGIPK